jgi:hypothetical protein
MKRLFYFCPNLDEYSEDDTEREQMNGPEDANLVGSFTGEYTCDRLILDAMHLPLLDLDYSAELIPSSHEGHFHLYLNKPVTWSKYVKVLEALRDAGLIEPGYCDNSIRRGQSFLRTPWTKKPDVT